MNNNNNNKTLSLHAIEAGGHQWKNFQVTKLTLFSMDKCKMRPSLDYDYRL